MTMNILCLIIAIPLTPSHCGVVRGHQVQDDSSQLRLPNTVFQLQNVKDFSDKPDQNTSMTKDNNKDHIEDDGAVALSEPEGGSEKKSRVSRSTAGAAAARSLGQTEPRSPPAPPPSLVALLALDIIAALFALHALAALFFILPN